MIRRTFVVLFAAWAVLAAGIARSAESATPNDTARFLAGLQPSEGSPLVPFAHERDWDQHANYMNSAFDKVETRQLSKIRKWSSEHLTNPRPTLFYMFGGPDFLYANAFFGNANTYVLSGLEPVGTVPDLTSLPRGSMPSILSNFRGSLGSILSVGYFITHEMRTALNSTRLSGTLPVLYVFLARSGKTIESVELINLDDKGEVHPGDGQGTKSAVHGVKIAFTDGERHKTLYYFSGDLSDDTFKRGGFAKFCDGLGVGDSLVKSASYLLHSGNFSGVRDFLLTHSSTILQDDTGIPAAQFDPARWKLSAFGRYLGPISIFADRYQPKLKEIYQKQSPNPLDFGIGYRWQADQSNLLVAVRTDLQTAQ
ncbi:MAG TPA: hypothetical protein VKT73_14065 [Xanthobacteraceae bacterium]|nr:hypothetical protein [Xanthobacteraceae bacterium]